MLMVCATPFSSCQPQRLPLSVDVRYETPLPELGDELGLLEQARGGPTHQDEQLVPLTGDRITLLHSYVHAGWQHATAQQWLRAETLNRLRTAAEALPDELGFAVFDGWRPLALQQELFDANEDPVIGAEVWTMVAPTSLDPATPPPHLTGGTVDLTLTWRGQPLALGTDFDDTTRWAQLSAYEDTPAPERALRRLLFYTLQSAGFVALKEEWWHYEYGTRLWSGITGAPTMYGPATP